MAIFHECDICKEDSIYLVRVEKDGQHLDACAECSEGLQRSRYYGRGGFKTALMVTEVTVEDKRYFTLVDNYGRYIPTKDMLKLADKLKEFSSLENIDEELEKENTKQNLSEYIGLQENEEGLFVIPEDFVKVERREFNSEKRNWSFKCGNCSEKVGSKTDQYYYSVYLSHSFILSKQDRACSPACSNVIAKDMVKEGLSKEENQFIAPINDFNIIVK